MTNIGLIGAGMIGSSVVYHLSKLGYSVKWIDSMPQGWFSTSKAAGLILHGSKKKVPKYTMAQETIRNIKTLESTLNENIGFVNCGSLTFNNYISNIKNIDVSPLQTAHLPNHIYYNMLDGYIDPIVLAGAYKRASTNHISVHNKANELIFKNNVVIGIRTDYKDYFGDVIDCTGCLFRVHWIQ